MRLSPLDPETHVLESAMAFAHLFQGRYDEALKWATKSLARHPNWMAAMRASAVANVLAGNIAEAREVVAQIAQAGPFIASFAP